MMDELFDEEYLRKQYDIAEHKRIFDAGKAEGKAEGRAEGRAEKTNALKSVAERLREIGMSEEQIREIISV